MSRHYVPTAVSSPRLLASAIGVAITATSTAHIAYAAEAAPANDGAIALDATSVTGEANQTSTDYKVEKSASQKYTAPLVDIPRTVTVVPQQVIKDTNAQNLQDALRTVPGITMGAGEGGNPSGDRPFIRGFDTQSSMYLDGVRDTGSQTREIFAVESIEVSKGPNSSIAGRGAAGGSINLITKKAHLGNSLDGAYTWGSDQTQRYTLDGNYQFLDTAAFRLNLMTHENNVAGRDEVNYDRWGVAPSLVFGLGTDTRVSLDYYHVESDDLPDSGIPYSLNSGVPGSRSSANPDKPTNGGDSDNFYGLVGRDFYKSRADISTIAIEHDLSDSLTVKNTLRHGNTLQDYIVTQPDDSKGNILNGEIWRRPNNRVSNTRTTTNQTDLFGEVYIAGFKNNFSTGIELSREASVKTGYTITGFGAGKCSSATGQISGVCTSFPNPDPHEAWDGTVARNDLGADTTGNTRAIYLVDTVELDPAWLLTMGLRYDHFDTKVKTRALTAGKVVNFKTEDTSEFVTGQLGLTWKPAENGSIYISYATSATPAGASLGEGADGNALLTATTTSDLKAEETTNYEIGTKWNLLQERLALTAAIFRTEKENARVLVDANTYQNVGTTRVDGLELTATGKLTNNWQVFAGYTYMDAKLVDGGAPRVGNLYIDGFDDGNQLPNTPNNSMTLWTTYNVTPKLTIGGGAFYVDDVFGNTTNSVMVDSYVRYDAMASYKLTKNVDLQLNVQNLTDELYYDKAYGNHYANQAAGRTALLTTSFHF
ncbi:TonB-dependent siderophore receptor [Pseudomonas defluvii]|uniref:TonB-dependent receptor n=1 Tax=unclassified Pseudomonas TaxID=196821 RepID=UPI000C19B8C2|nr:TonB-dependent siderophore receptor [Pseudomonas sp. HLS-6]ATR81894.1 TonB-dependent siderophore receptor [Pseudomonas sp. HLS-6]MEE3632868.1 TonB-dependent siderophore receptor [Pseudomonas sp. AL 58]WJM98359.1 TonB-dependent siderophore receptor [Pseudomonas defluvii]